MIKGSIAELVEKAAIARGDSPLPRDYIVDALKKIENEDTDVKKYPTGHPSLKGVYKIALELYEANQTRH